MTLADVTLKPRLKGACDRLNAALVADPEGVALLVGMQQRVFGKTAGIANRPTMRMTGLDLVNLALGVDLAHPTPAIVPRVNDRGAIERFEVK